MKWDLTKQSWKFHPPGQVAGHRIDNSRKQSSWLLDSVKLLVLVGFSWSYVFVFCVCVCGLSFTLIPGRI